jgi:adenosylcobinamide kinase/adenosylcobinamide-phosphate guanylyltransferase
MSLETDYFRNPKVGSLFALGGARSGKSAFAERQARAADATELVYIATAQAYDDEMRDRIERHRLDRGPGWITIEAPFGLEDALREADAPGRAIVVDCLTLWLSNLMLDDIDPEPRAGALASLLPSLTARVALVSNEVGYGIVPENALARAFRDAQGRLNQRVAAAADAVVLVAAGLPLELKAPA